MRTHTHTHVCIDYSFTLHIYTCTHTHNTQTSKNKYDKSSTTCTEAPAAYQNTPETPTLYATLHDSNSVAAHVHLDATPDATRPVLRFLPALMNRWCCGLTTFRHA